MTDEEFQRKMDFIVDHQAQFASDIQQLREAQAKTEQALARTEQALARTEQVVAQTEQIVARLARVTAEGFKDVARLANVTSEGFKDVTAKIDALVDSHIRLTDLQSRTDENLRNLIAVVDRYFREGRNGESGR